MNDPYQQCSCHGHIWPCREIDQQAVTDWHTRRMEALLAKAQPGVCAGCGEAITDRQASVGFPEVSRFVPGAPGPMFHAGRESCWAAAERYERAGRLADDPQVARLASCPGLQFVHEIGTRAPECTAGVECTGLHGPSAFRRRRRLMCWERVHVLNATGGYARPGRDCGYRARHGVCLAIDISAGGASLGPTAGDLMWEKRYRQLG